MHTITVNLSSDEWQRIREEASKLWANERISQSEVVRRCTLTGVETLRRTAAAKAAEEQARFQATMTVKDSHLQPAEPFFEAIKRPGRVYYPQLAVFDPHSTAKG
jgi:hypothetical protein